MPALEIQPQNILLFDEAHFESELHGLAILSFGEAVLHDLPQLETEWALYFWPLEQLVYLGMIDAKLPFFQAGLQGVCQAGFRPVLRSAGGLAVVSDAGVLNMTLWVREGSKKWSIDQGYEVMQAFIKAALPEVAEQIQAYEISDSYCPGTYDLSINGKKFAGMAQRRYKDTIGISIYISVNGNQHRRGELIRDFYRRGLNDQKGAWNYPNVRPSSMATLSELMDRLLTIEEMKERIVCALERQGFTVKKTAWQAIGSTVYQKAHERMMQRNRQAGL